MAKKSQALALWDKQLAEAAERSAGVVAGIGTGGSYFKTAGGILRHGDSVIPNNEMGVIVLDHALENKFFAEAFDSNSPGSTPDCYAMGRDVESMAPHAAVVDPVHPSCKGCPNNEFGSADTGRGKACGNRVRLACLPAGVFASGRFEPIVDPAEIGTAEVGYLSVPPTSLKAWKSYVDGLRSTLGRPPFGVYTKVALQPDPKTQFALTFTVLGQCGPELAKILIERNAREEAAEFEAYPVREDEPKARKKKVTKKKVAKKKKRFTR